MTNYFKKQLGGYLFCFLVSVAVLAEDRRIIYATQMPTPEDHISQNFSESCEVDSEHCNRNVEELCSLNYRMICQHQKLRFCHLQEFVMVLKVIMG